MYRRSVSILARVAARLNVRAGESQLFDFKLNVVELDEFPTQKDRLMSPPILALPQQGQRYNTDTGACG